MNITLNIGLREGTNGPLILPQLALAKALHILGHCDIKVKCFRYRVQQSATEPTLILNLTLAGSTFRTVQAIETMCRQLNQEAIAVFVHELDRGFIYGPNAAAWGAFNTEFFLQLDGSEGECPLDDVA